MVTDKDDLFSDWTANTRLSPVFSIARTCGNSPNAFQFLGKWTLFFVGPIHPTSVPALAHDDVRVWLTLGLFNVLIATQSDLRASEIKKWAKKNCIELEKWSLLDGEVKRVECVNGIAKGPEDTNWKSVLTALWERPVSGELREAIQEYCPLMAATISRSRRVTPNITNDLVGLNDGVSAFLVEALKSAKEGKHIQCLGHLLTINAALSRFSSQTFAGTSPITTTECHFWLHSMLGVGVASLAFRNVCAFVDQQLGNARIGERFAALKDVTANFDLLLDFPPDCDYLDSVTISESDKVVPILAYFSARDGYRSTEWAVSAPLAAVSACNSRRWSLLTVTHEFSHVAVRSILAELYPDFMQPTKMNECIDLLSEVSPKTVFMQIRKLMIISIIAMDNAAVGRPMGQSVDVVQSTLKALLQRWRTDADRVPGRATRMRATRSGRGGWPFQAIRTAGLEGAHRANVSFEKRRTIPQRPRWPVTRHRANVSFEKRRTK